MEVEIESVSGLIYSTYEQYNYDERKHTIIINSLDDLFNLSRKIDKRIIIDSNRDILLVYDDYIE